MAIQQGLTNSFKAELFLAVHDFRATSGDTFKIALYEADATINASTTAYTATNEITGVNYTAGGATLTNNGVTTVDTSGTSGGGYIDFADATWSNATFTARGALIYNTTPSANNASGAALTNPSVAVLDFGSNKTVVNQTFTITFPATGITTAIIRITDGS